MTLIKDVFQNRNTVENNYKYIKILFYTVIDI